MRLSRRLTVRRTDARRLRLATVVAVVATASAGLGAGTAGAAAAPGTASHEARGVYLALGDSVAFGYRPLTVTPPATYLDARNFTSYANYTAKATGLRLVNASCPAETTATMLSATAADFGCRQYRSLFPLHASYPGTQLRYALRFLKTHPATRLVTLNIGANDVSQCLATPGCDVPAAVAQVATNVSRMLHRLRTEAHYQGTIVTLTYYQPPQDPLSLVKEINAALVTATRRHGGEVANGLSAFQVASRRFGGDACQAGLLIRLPDGSCDVHPTAAGHLVLAVPVTLAYVQAQSSAARHAA